MKLDGKVVLITGGSEGIGSACADEFRKRGARLALTARNEAKLKQVAAADELIVPADLLQSADRKRIVDATVARYGRVDVLVNNAGVGLYAPANVAKIEDARKMFELNLFAPLELTQLIAPVMRNQGGGTIVNVSSIAGKVPLPWLTLYSASKYGLCALTDALRIELQRSRIHLIAVCPGYVKTDFQNHVIGGQPPYAIQKSRPFHITAGQCARAIVTAVERDARTVVTPATGWFFIAAARLFPTIVDWFLKRMYFGNK
jgi:short-subunit dehydrogenase